MLSSTRRRILNIISVSLAICCVGYGLILKYNNPPSESGIDFSVQKDSYTPNLVEVVRTEDQSEREDILSNPD